MLHAALVSNALAGLDDAFVSNEHIHYRTETIGPKWAPDLSADELVIAPNGTDHVVLWGARDRIRAHLDHGGVRRVKTPDQPPSTTLTPFMPGNVGNHPHRRSTFRIHARSNRRPLHQ